jgi:hypothetical protein
VTIGALLFSRRKSNLFRVKATNTRATHQHTRLNYFISNRKFLRRSVWKMHVTNAAAALTRIKLKQRHGANVFERCLLREFECAVYVRSDQNQQWWRILSFLPSRRLVLTGGGPAVSVHNGRSRGLLAFSYTFGGCAPMLY